jgi:regulator of protease activity HflC (stomatin/prohibitin superfamily)
MKKLVLLSLLAVSSIGCTRVDPGNIGLKVNMYGTDRGVDDVTLETGRVWYNPITEDIYTFPTYMQNAVWTKDEIDESPEDESITFNSIEGAVVNADIAISYQILPEHVKDIFTELRQDSEYIKGVYVRSKTRDAFSRHASKMKVVDIFGSKKEELLSAVKEDLGSTMPGFKFDIVTFVGGLRVDPLVEQSISSTIQATQRAIEAENKVKQSTAEAQQKVEEARGLAESILLEAKARSEANEILTKSLSPALLQYESLQRWDGVLPKVTGEVIPFISIDNEVK